MTRAGSWWLVAGGLSLFGCAGAGANASSSSSPATSHQPPATSESIGDMAAKQGGFFSRDESSGTDAPSLASGLQALLIEGGKRPKLDGVPREWPALVGTSAVGGDAHGYALAMAVQYDDANVYVAANVKTPAPSADDHVALVIAVPGAGGALTAYEIGFFAGKPGESGGTVRFTAGALHGDVSGSKIVEAPANGGYTFEASFPWSALPAARTVRVGLRGIGRLQTAAHGTVLATGSGDVEHPRQLPALPTEPEQSLIEGLLHQKNLDATAPKADVYADVAGDAMKERISVFDRFFTICGHGYRGGKEYFYRDLNGELVRLDARDLLGRGKEDLLVRRRFDVAGTKREWFEIWQVAESGEPQTLFSHEIAITKGAQRVSNVVHLAGKDVEIAIEPAAGWDATSYSEPVANDVAPALLPWGPVKSETWRFEGGKYAKVSSVPNPNAAKPAAAEQHPVASVTKQVEPPTPPSSKGGDLSKQLLEQYRRDHGVAADVAPKADIQVNVSDDPRPERVVVIDRDIVVFGPGFKNGTAYAFVSMPQFADAADVKDVTVRDLTGDGAADIVVRGVRHVTPSTGGALDLEATFVYTLKNGTVTRVFGIETAREQGNKRVQGLVQFIPAKGGKGFEIDVRPGRATGWTEKTYPWAQDQPGTGAVEPLLLPWGGIASLRYAWNGTTFALNASP